ncbi:fumarylacetoacetate hydrolase family protein [Rhizorhabdus wittichii]|uniref:fumarylacetoacetate hydrolase family protein n=1 Tax=Rhizorhabdus wittichii TaxID=160791 RepID=UPI0002F05A74|nr:fumarylacetoacetate hydrolase family protein [Rhizorhabdus wittichii]
MRLVSCEIDGEPAYGLLVGDRIARLDASPGAAPDLKSFIAAAHAAGWPPMAAEADIPLDQVRLLPPIPNPDKVLCVATNFREPAREGKPEPEYPLVFTRFANSFTGHGQPLAKPDRSEAYDFEGELAVVIGKGGHRIPASEAMAHVGGYCCLNDGSVRDWQKHSTQFTPGKNFHRSGSFGPWIVTADEIPDPTVLTLQTRVNGVVKQRIGIDRMIFDIPWLIAYFSTFTPLVPGDVIATGTPSGFGSSRTPPEYLSIGDAIEVEIGGIGILRNIVGGEAVAG